MQNKLLVSVDVPYLDTSFDIYIPNNCKVGYIKKTIINIINSLYYVELLSNARNFRLINRISGMEYDLDMTVGSSSIMNGTKLVFM